MWNQENQENFQDLLQNRIEMVSKMQKFGGLRIMILHVLEDDPKNGVEIMDAIQKHHEERHKMRQNSHRHPHHHRMRVPGSKRPSPGSIYPMLKKMVDEDLVSKGADGRYDLTANGQDTAQKIFGQFQGMHKRRRSMVFTVEDALTQIDSHISYLEDIKMEKLAPHREQMRVLLERFNRVMDNLPAESSEEKK
ncbi:MAG: PadR family transcriptional regulator [Methanobacteriaceae archaeon]